MSDKTSTGIEVRHNLFKSGDSDEHIYYVIKVLKMVQNLSVLEPQGFEALAKSKSFPDGCYYICECLIQSLQLAIERHQAELARAKEGSLENASPKPNRKPTADPDPDL